MTPLLFSVLLLQAAPATAAPESSAPAAPPATAAETLQGLETIYSTTCGQTGILYHAYDDLCDGLRKQIATYRQKAAHDEARLKVAQPATTPKP